MPETRVLFDWLVPQVYVARKQYSNGVRHKWRVQVAFAHYEARIELVKISWSQSEDISMIRFFFSSKKQLFSKLYLLSPNLCHLLGLGVRG